MAEITINSEALEASAKVFEEVKDKIQIYLNDIKNEMENLRKSYQGEAAETLYNKFAQLSDDFEERATVIQQYADYLKETAASWEGKELDIIDEGNNKKEDA